MYDVERHELARPEMPPRQVSPRSSLVPVVMVVVPLIVLLAGVVAFTGPAGLLMMGVVACVPAFVLFHYVLWGHWLGKSLRDSMPPDEDDEP